MWTFRCVCVCVAVYFTLWQCVLWWHQSPCQTFSLKALQWGSNAIFFTSPSVWTHRNMFLWSFKSSMCNLYIYLLYYVLVFGATSPVCSRSCQTTLLTSLNKFNEGLRAAQKCPCRLQSHWLCACLSSKLDIFCTVWVPLFLLVFVIFIII